MPDGTVISVATGLADRETGALLSTDHKMLSGSVGKTYVAALMVKLASDGRP